MIKEPDNFICMHEKNVQKCFFPEYYSENHQQIWENKLFEAGKATDSSEAFSNIFQERTFFSWWFSHGTVNRHW
jgi:hypothetical protein